MPFLETRILHPIDADTLKRIQNTGFWAASFASLTLSATPSLAQIAGDGSLGTQVNGNPTAPCTGTCFITDGSTRGQNLFHSLQQFSLPNSTDNAGFLTAPGIQNVIVRVTGAGQPFISTINGTIFTLNETITAISPVNLFLINPNGIIFGPNARLNVGRSFVATTLDAITFPGWQFFSAINPGNANSLLTIVGDPSGFLASQKTPKDIAVQGSVLGMYPGQSMLLLGGNVTLDNAFLGFFRLPGQGGRIELAGIAGEGSIGLTTGQNELRLAIPNNIARADIAIRNNSTLETASVGGSMTFTARNLDISGGSRLGVGRFSSTIGSLNQIGDLTFNTAEILSIREESFIGNLIGSGAFGRSGNINIETGSLLITGGSRIDNSLFGRGDVGNLRIKVRDLVVIDGRSSRGFESRISSQISRGGIGTIGDISIETGSLQISNGARLNVQIFGRGNIGNILLRATEQIILDNGGFIDSNTSGTSIEQGGNIFILAGDSLEIRNGRVSSFVGEFGDGGDIDIAARNRIVLDGGSIISTGFSTATGRGGNIRIAAGDALEVRNGAGLISEAGGFGDGGNIEISVRGRVLIDGTTDDTRFSSNISSIAESNSRGGNIDINGGTLQLSNGGQLNATTIGRGDGGNIALRVHDTTTLTGWNAPSSVQTSINTSTKTDGKGGNISLDTSTLTISNNAAFNAVTTSRGSGGNIAVNVAGNLELLNGGQLNTTTEASGQTGRISLNADQILISGVGFNNQPSALTVQFTASSAAGEIELNARRLTLDNQGRIFSLAPSGNGGNLTLNIQDLFLLRRGSQVSVSAGTAQTPGNGGNITISAPNGFIVGVKSENSDITANAFTGSGGRVNIVAQGIYGLQFRPNPTDFSDITASSTLGVSGTVTLNTPGLDPSRGLTELPENIIDTNRILATSCIVRQGSARGTFFITGNGGLPQRPGTPAAPWFPTGTVQAIPDEHAGTPPHPDPIVEMDEIYRLPNGQVILGRTCTTE